MTDYLIPAYRLTPTTDVSWWMGLLNPEPWRDDAACLEYDPDMWFPDKGKSQEDAAVARRICKSCPVRAMCLEAGLGERYGIWGGEGRNARDHKRLKAS